MVPAEPGQKDFVSLRIRDWDINICCFCELASSPSCGSTLPGLGRTGEISSRCFDLLSLTLLSDSQSCLEEPRLPKSLCTLWLIPLLWESYPSDVFVSHPGCRVAGYLCFGEPSFVEARRLLATMECVSPFEIVKLLVKLVPTSNSRGGEGDLVGSSLFVALSSVLVLH